MSLAITTSYAGEFSGKYIAAALLSGDTLANEEIKNKNSLNNSSS